MRRMNTLFAIAVSAIQVVALSACTDSTDNPVNPNPQPADGIPAVVKNLPGYETWDSPVDYNNAHNWATLPTKADKAYDVFYLQPTSWNVAEGETSRVASLDNQTMRYGGIICSAIHAQAVFGDYCNVFVPIIAKLMLNILAKCRGKRRRNSGAMRQAKILHRH